MSSYKSNKSIYEGS